MAAGGGSLHLLQHHVSTEGLAGHGVQVQAGPAGASPGGGPVRLVDLDGDEDEAGDETDGGHRRGEHQQFVFVFLKRQKTSSLVTKIRINS